MCAQRDVPGFTRNAIPILTAEGIKAVTIGVNGGSAPPGVPKNTPFIWRDKASGTEILIVLHPGALQPVKETQKLYSMYSKNYLAMWLSHPLGEAIPNIGPFLTSIYLAVFLWHSLRGLPTA